MPRKRPSPDKDRSELHSSLVLVEYCFSNWGMNGLTKVCSIDVTHHHGLVSFNNTTLRLDFELILYKKAVHPDNYCNSLYTVVG